MTEAAATARDVPGGRQLYLAVWRWHFYAGVVVLPFLVLLALTGLVMLIQPPLEALLHAERYHVEARPPALPPAAQVERVRAHFPGSRVVAYLAAPAVDRPAQVAIAPADRLGAADAHGTPATRTVFVDPYLGRVLDVVDPEATVYAWAKRLHGTLWLGTAGDAAIEVLAGSAVLLLCSGVFLAWPRDGLGWVRRLLPGSPFRRHRGWREVHAALGIWVALPLLFFLLSGLAWTGFWGGSLVQAWSSIPSAELDAVPADHTHASLNRAPLHEVPWALEQTPLPQSGASSVDRPAGTLVAVVPPVNLDRVVAFARAAGFQGLRVHLPAAANLPWTVSASTMSGDVQDPRLDRTVHIDAQSGRLLADLGFADYPLMGKAMAAGVPLHQAGLGTWNLLANAAFCLIVLLLCVAAALAWWRRRPAGGRLLVPPPAPDATAWKGVMVVMLATSVLFPLTALALISVLMLDRLALSGRSQLSRLLR